MRASLRILLTLFGLVLLTQGACAGCLSRSEMRAAINAGQVISFAQVQGSLGAQGFGTVQSVDLCTSGSGHVYRVVAIGPSGTARRLVIDARSGAILSQ